MREQFSAVFGDDSGASGDALAALNKWSRPKLNADMTDNVTSFTIASLDEQLLQPVQ